ncbi:MAG: NAD(P)/FAD-dependent oxidoreductase, partial [Planctomycetota bacterium]|nr:NAD(P)/FAD-dependent oxidoreductase [Planctomycetota bacterium]
MKTTFDAIVIGAGPAGSLSAILLNRAGWRTALIERAPRHRNKTCGHCLSPRALPLLERHNLLDETRRASRGSTAPLPVHLAPGRAITAPIARPDPGLLIPRHRFDQLLIDRAAREGVHVIQPAAARFADMHDRAALVHIREGARPRIASASLIVAADGLRSRFARDARIPMRTTGRKFGFSFDLPASTAPEFAESTVHMFVSRHGYLGVARQSDNTLHAAALVGPRRENDDEIDPFTFLRNLAHLHPRLAPIAESASPHTAAHFIAAGPMPCAPALVARQRLALVGDAAGYHEPFTGEGIT